MTLPEAADLSSPIFLDGGTTNTRAWLAPEGRPLARSDASVGLRDVAVGARGRFETALRDLLVDIRRKGAAAGIPPPSCVVAAGMIASNQGLGDVPQMLTAPRSSLPAFCASSLPWPCGVWPL